MKAFHSLILRDCRLRYRQFSEILQPLLFFIMIVSLFPLSINPDPKILRLIAPGIIWVAALIANLMAFNLLFNDDYNDGTLEQILISAQPLLPLIAAKIIAHWLTSSFPLIIMTPLLAYLCHLDGLATQALLFSLLLGTPILSLLGGIISALLVHLQRGAMLLALLAIPLYIPILIFATGSVLEVEKGLNVSGLYALLGACLVFACCFAPMTIRAALRMSVAQG